MSESNGSRMLYLGHAARLLLAVSLGAVASAQTGASTPAADVAPPAAPSRRTAPLPKIPAGKSTVIGGEIRNVDPVRDQFTLHVFGGKAIKILFDERTQVFRDGEKIPVLTLRPDDHASVETTLDGTRVFALRIHMLSKLPQGQLQGRVLEYSAQSHELTMKPTSADKPVTLQVSSSTPVTRVGRRTFAAQQHGVSDLTPGAVIDVTFKAGSAGHGVATNVNVLAVPGAVFVFEGSVTSLDTSAGRLVLQDEDDKQRYDIAYGPSSSPGNREMHEGSRLKVTTNFDGTRYVATQITIE